MAKEETKAKPGKYYQGIGRRKTAVASVRVFEEESGEFIVNKQELAKYFPVKELQEAAKAPLAVVAKKKVGVSVWVKGGGMRGQAEALRHGLSRALVKMNADVKKELKEMGFLTRDARKVERKKPGLKKARRAPQFSKR